MAKRIIIIFQILTIKVFIKLDVLACPVTKHYLIKILVDLFGSKIRGRNKSSIMAKNETVLNKRLDKISKNWTHKK
ncbi:hypothetical protein BpHYR1_018025 [Brachionus plicatilis]|uniref:Uncharacterized protein n=1 Tax=Brachionus plicatilis TaxID=10195 RepID=A0A3M7PKT6_BRAPC|nr:hypothetical protein BpHYR1_018025 [Brachionus plicatilis]